MVRIKINSSTSVNLPHMIRYMKACISHHLTLNFSIKYKQAMIHGYLVFLYSRGLLEEQTCLGSYRECLPKDKDTQTHFRTVKCDG